MSDKKRENLFAKLGHLQTAKATQDDAPVTDAPPPSDAASSPAPASPPKPKPAAAKKEPEPTKGKRHHPDYCQANAYVLKKVRRAVERELLDEEELDYSQLVENLLTKWLKSRGVSE
jgi:hypothetical protein